MKVAMLIIGILLLAIGVFAAIAPEGVLDILGLSREEGQWGLHQNGIPYPEYQTVYQVDPNIVRGAGAALATIGLVLVALEVSLEKRGK